MLSAEIGQLLEVGLDLAVMLFKVHQLYVSAMRKSIVWIASCQHHRFINPSLSRRTKGRVAELGHDGV